MAAISAATLLLPLLYRRPSQNGGLSNAPSLARVNRISASEYKLTEWMVKHVLTKAEVGGCALVAGSTRVGGPTAYFHWTFDSISVASFHFPDASRRPTSTVSIAIQRDRHGDGSTTTATIYSKDGSSKIARSDWSYERKNKHRLSIRSFYTRAALSYFGRGRRGVAGRSAGPTFQTCESSRPRRIRWPTQRSGSCRCCGGAAAAREGGSRSN